MIKKRWHTLVLLVYNALDKIARRLHMTSETYFGAAYTFVVLGITMLFIGLDKNIAFLALAGGVIVFLGACLMLVSMRDAKKEKKKADEEENKKRKEQSERDNHLFTLLEAIARKMGADIDNSSKEDGMNEKKSEPQPPLTEKRFEALLTKASQPISEESKPVPKGKRTSESRPSDGCSDTHTNQDKIEGKEG